MGQILGLGRSPGGGNGNSLQYSCLKKSHGQRSLAGYSPKCRKESDRTLSLSKHYNSNQGHLEMASKKITEFELNCACLTLIYIHRDNFLSFLFIAQMIGPIISVVGNLTPCFFLLCTLSSVQFSSVTQSCPTLCDPMNRSTPGLPTPGVHPNPCALCW